MRIIFFGSGSFAVPILQSVIDAGHEVAGVVTQPDRPAGRGRKLRPTPVREWAEAAGLRTLAAEDVNAEAVVREVLGWGARLGVVAAFGQKIGPGLLEGFPAGMINAHSSLLPKYRGAAPVNWAIIQNEEVTGVTVFRLVERMDAGPILLQRETLIKPGETAEELAARLAGVACDAVRAALECFAETDNPPMTEQDESQATRAPKLSKADRYVDFAAPAWQVARRICGLWPWPCAAGEYVKADGSRRERVLFARAFIAEDAAGPPLPPGTIRDDLCVQTGEGAVRIAEIKPAGGRRMRFEDFARGRRLAPGDRFESSKPAEPPSQQEGKDVRSAG